MNFKKPTIKNNLLIFFLTLSVYLVFLLSPNISIAKESNQFITIVNPVRISNYNQNPSLSIQNQYKIIKQMNLPATWLLTYDALSNKSVTSTILQMNKSQEIGIFLEITPNFTKDADIIFNESGSWHHADSIFLSGYTQVEREKLIDLVFNKFKSIFGFYPVSVGSWWTDAYSLNYIKTKYNINSNLGCSDQFSTDGYKLWGQYWSTPYYPSKYHTGIPASSLENKLDVVNLEWAARDPLNGYDNSLYSTQDYMVTNNKLDTKYFEKLVKLYASAGNNEFGQITVGLESDLSPESYNNEFKNQMVIIKKFIDTKNYKALTMNDFANWYKNNFNGLSPDQLIKSSDFLGTNKEVTWYQNPKYRIGLSFNKDTNKTEVFDLKIFDNNLIDPYYFSPNYQSKLFITISSLIDKIANPSSVISINNDVRSNYYPKLPDDLNKMADELPIKDQQKTIYDFSAAAIHFFKSPKSYFKLLTRQGWDNFKKVPYSIPQEELYALAYLSKLPKDKILIFDNECLQCSWNTNYKHPALDNRRGYIKNLTNFPIIYNKSVFNAKTQKEASVEFKKTGAKYIYLVKFEKYIEKLEFSPGDYGIEKIFENANTQIWAKK